VHTPGHASNHLCFLLEEERTLFSGDHIMDGSTVVIAPPDGDMAVYLESLRKVAALRLRRIAPGHGFPIEDPKARIRHYIDHRLAREGQILEAVQSGTDAIEAIVDDLYAEVDEELHPVAAKSVHAHLLKLEADGKVIVDGNAWTAIAS
jgi:glyoxylase-like metal-dependent hydrolase (beta-lactamase superfamily II)